MWSLALTENSQPLEAALRPSASLYSLSLCVSNAGATGCQVAQAHAVTWHFTEERSEAERVPLNRSRRERQKQKLAFVLGSELLGLASFRRRPSISVSKTVCDAERLKSLPPAAGRKGLRASHVKRSAMSTDPAFFPPTECGTVKLVTAAFPVASCPLNYRFRCVSFNVAVACSVLLATWT